MSLCSPFAHRLEPTQIFQLAEAVRGLLTVTDGTLWLTRGDDVDIILELSGCTAMEAACHPGTQGLGARSTSTTSVLDANSFARET